MQKHDFPFIFVRHGNTAMNQDGDKIRGWKDVPLSPKGEKEAEELGQKLKSKDFDCILSSDLKRAQQTAEAISKHTGAPIDEVSFELRPWNAGYLTGQEANKILSKLNSYIDDPNEKIPEGESFNDFKERFLTKIEEIKKEYQGKKVCIVAHHRNNVLLDAWTEVGAPESFTINRDRMKQRGISPAEYKEYII